jgi:hypothetical protein
MRSVILVVLLVASAAIARATPADTDQAQEREATAERKVTELTAQQKAQSQRYESELQTIDKLKQQRVSWRRNRELGDNLAASLETANQLAATTRELATAQDAVGTTRKALIDAIDAEVAAGATGPRADRLAQLRGQFAPAANRAHKIVIPDTQVDPLADPEELDQQAAALRQSETQLSVQVAGLEAQGKELDHMALLRKQHERAGELGTRDDDQSHRNATHATGGQGDGAAAPTSIGTPPTGAGANTDRSPSGFESEASIVLADVVDAPTIDSLARAQRSGNPQERAAAVKKTRDAVAARLDRLRQQRAQIESRAKTLRQKH